jgi:hypothetical protein
MSVGQSWSSKPASDVRPGDRVRVASGKELTVSRIDAPFLERDEMLCFIEDTAERWFAQPVRLDAEVHVLEA